MKTLKQLADDAIHVQDACNLIAVANSFAQVIKDVQQNLADAGKESGTDAIRNHPIVQLWADKIYDMVGRPNDPVRFSEIYFTVEQIAFHASESRRAESSNAHN